jgi:anti-sigma-K factor RskA
MQLIDMPPLESNKAYQLWMITQGKVISLGVFNPVHNKSANYPFSIPHIEDTQNLNFVLTIEPPTGSESPSRSVFLTGSIQ